MRRSGFIVLVGTVLVWIVVAVVLGAGRFSDARPAIPPSGVSPACLPAAAGASAALAGTGVDVSPAPETDTANPDTQISFLGASARSIRGLSVRGSRSGYHRGRLLGYSQGDGASFVPAQPFRAGERVLVRALLGAPGAERQVGFGFRVETRYSTAGIPTFPDPPARPSAYQSFVSEPELHPPTLAVSTPDRDAAAGEVMMTVGPGPGQDGPLIFTPQGRLVWFEDLARGVSAENLSVQRYGGASALTWWRGKVLALGFGEGEDVVMDSAYRTLATVRAGNGYRADLHDFQLGSQGVAYITVYNVMRCDLSAVKGARNGVIVDTAVQAVDIKSGLVRWEWHSLDHVGVSESHVPVPSDTTPWDWFHLNSVDLEPDGNLLISARSTWTAYQLERGSGTIAWRLGGANSSFHIPPGADTAWQHDARLQADGTVTLFDNGSNPIVHSESRTVRLALDTGRRTVRVVGSYPHPGSPLRADSQGNAQLLADGNTVIGWGAIPSVSELDPGGALVFDAHLPPGNSSYRAFRFPWVGRPQRPPVGGARVLATGDSTAVFASWNGASAIASWRVLGGASTSTLTAQASMPDSGFESSVTFPGVYRYLAVQALDATGAVIGTSLPFKS